MRLDGAAATAALTVMRPARPVVWEPAAVSAPVIGVVPSRNSGNCALPLAGVVTVDVADSALTTLVVLLALTACNMVPDGLENCRLVPNAALSCVTTAAMPPAKLTPMIWLFGLDGEVCNGSVPPAPSATSVIVCWTLPLSV